MRRLFQFEFKNTLEMIKLQIYKRKPERVLETIEIKVLKARQ